MKLPAIACAAALSILIAGCENQPEETPALEDAIPLDSAEDAAGADGEDEGTAEGDSTPSTDGSGASGSGSSMQSGSNADGGRAPDPSRSKLQPAD